MSLIDISIHAPRKGSDLAASSSRAAIKHFNPRPPQGERQAIHHQREY